MVDVTEYVRKPMTRQVKVLTKEWHTVPRDVSYMEPTWYEEKVPVKKQVWTDSKETRHRTVCRREPVTEIKKVTVNTGHWETQHVEIACASHHGCGSHHGCRSHCGECCDSCAPATRTVCRKVWVPSTEERDITCTTYKVTKEQVPYDVTVRKCVWVDDFVTVKKCKMERKTKTVDVKECKMVESFRDETYYVCEPQKTQKEIDVTVCRRVAVEVAADCSGCGSVVSSGCCN